MRITILLARKSFWAALAVSLCIGMCSCASTARTDETETIDPKPVLHNYTVRDAKKYVVSIGGSGRYFGWRDQWATYVYVKVNNAQGYFGRDRYAYDFPDSSTKFEKLELFNGDLIQAITGRDPSDPIRIGAQKIHEIGSIAPHQFSPVRAVAAIDYLRTLERRDVLTAVYTYLDIASAMSGRLWGANHCQQIRALIVLRALFVPIDDDLDHLLPIVGQSYVVRQTVQYRMVGLPRFPVSMAGEVPFLLQDLYWLQKWVTPPYADYCGEYCELSKQDDYNLTEAVTQVIKSTQKLKDDSDIEPHLLPMMASQEEIMVQFLRCISNLAPADQELLETVNRRGVRDNEDLMTKVREAANRLMNKEFQYDESTHSWTIVE